MKKNRWVLRMMVLLVISGMMSMTVSLAAEAGSSQDPLVTMSYLNETFLGNVLQKVDGSEQRYVVGSVSGRDAFQRTDPHGRYRL